MMDMPMFYPLGELLQKQLKKFALSRLTKNTAKPLARAEKNKIEMIKKKLI
jgi:hypothetical protein